jgi:hypothetical protein
MRNLTICTQHTSCCTILFCMNEIQWIKLDLNVCAPAVKNKSEVNSISAAPSKIDELVKDKTNDLNY